MIRAWLSPAMETVLDTSRSSNLRNQCSDTWMIMW
jgi:hypothetical protein